jgi:hypothetical protein
MFDLMPFGWLWSSKINPTHPISSYEDIIFIYAIFIYAHFVRKTTGA